MLLASASRADSFGSLLHDVVLTSVIIEDAASVLETAFVVAAGRTSHLAGVFLASLPEPL